MRSVAQRLAALEQLATPHVQPRTSQEQATIDRAREIQAERPGLPFAEAVLQALTEDL